MSENNIYLMDLVVTLFIFLGLFVFLFSFFKSGISKKQKIAYLISGLIISSLNTIIEALAYKYDLYEIKGQWKIFATPFPMFLLWVLLSFIYIDVYYSRVRNKVPTLLYVILGIVLGWSFDFIGWKTGLLEIKEKGSPFINASVWIVLVSLTLAIPKIISFKDN